MIFHDRTRDMSILKQGRLRCAFQNISSPIGQLSDPASFLQDFKSQRSDSARHVRWNGHSLLNSLLGLRNYSQVFNQSGGLKDAEISTKLGEFSNIVLRHEDMLGFDPQQSNFHITCVWEDVGLFKKRLEPGFSDFHRDALFNPAARVYIVSDHISPTILKDNDGTTLTTIPYVVYCMNGHSLHSRGPVLNPEQNFSGVARNFARFIVT